MGILSFLVTMLMGWQIWNAVSIDKKIKEEIELAKASLIESINKTKEELSISGVKSTVTTLYKVESTYLNVCLLAGDYKNGISTLRIMFEYAVSLNDSDTLNNFAKTLVDSKNGFCNRVLTKQDYEIIYNSFLLLFQSALIHLPASGDQVPRIFEMMNDIHYCMSEWKKTI